MSENIFINENLFLKNDRFFFKSDSFLKNNRIKKVKKRNENDRLTILSKRLTTL